MIIDNPERLREVWSPDRFPAVHSPVPRSVFMVRPDGFAISDESASDCSYIDTHVEVDPDRAVAQFDALVDLVRSCGIEVKVFPGDPATPDAVFPNNVFSTVPGTLIVGSMCHEVRRREAARADIRSYFAHLGYGLTDLSGEHFKAELTGTVVIDRSRRIGFCGMTSRVDDAGLAAMVEAFDLGLTYRFDLLEREYHTNVVMSVLAGRACVVNPGAFMDSGAADAIDAIYPGRVLRLDGAEKNAFAGNCIALTPTDVFMSQTAANGLRPSSRETLEDWGFTIRTAALDEIEKGGGSLRCMIGEIY
jgi:hypothetical protein